MRTTALARRPAPRACGLACSRPPNLHIRWPFPGSLPAPAGAMDRETGMDGSSERSLSRREFLERTAYTAGVAGLPSRPAGTLLAEAAKAHAKSSGLPAPRNVPIDHFVILMMENRSFDHYFG